MVLGGILNQSHLITLCLKAVGSGEDENSKAIAEKGRGTDSRHWRRRVAESNRTVSVDVRRTELD